MCTCWIQLGESDLVDDILAFKFALDCLKANYGMLAQHGHHAVCVVNLISVLVECSEGDSSESFVATLPSSYYVEFCY